MNDPFKSIVLVFSSMISSVVLVALFALPSYEQLGKAETQQAYLLQRTNDLLEQIERLKAIDTTENPELVIAVSQELRSVYETLDRLF